MDMSRLPEHVRRKLESRLALLPPHIRDTIEAKLEKLPAAQVEQALDRASPLIDRLLGATRQGGGHLSGGRQDSSEAPSSHAIPRSGGATVSGVRSAARADDAGSHYNTTVQRGDAPLPAMGAVVLALLGVAFVTWRLGWWSF
jgi:hypothetical protein